MKKLLLIFFVLAFTRCFAQTPPKIERGTSTVIPVDWYLWPKSTFKLPVFVDTSAATTFITSKSIDTIALKIYVIADSSEYIRTPKTSGSGNFWKKSGGSEVTTTIPLVKTGNDIALTYGSNYFNVFNSSLVTKVPVFTAYSALRAISATELSTGTIYKVNVNDQEGEFRWDATSTETDDGAMVIQRTGTATGRFIRNVETFINAKWFGAVGDGSTNNSTAFQSMFDWIQNHPASTYNVWIAPGNYKFNSTVTLPNRIATTAESIRLTIEGYGARLFTTTNGVTIFQRLATSQTQAQDTLISNWIGAIKGIVFEGNSGTGQCGMRLGAMFSWVVQDCNFSSLDTGLVVRFSLGGTFRNLRFTANVYENLNVFSGELWGGSDANSGSNANLFENIRVYGASGSYSHFHSDASDAVLIKNFISEGAKPRYNFILDAHASSTVKTCVVEDVHVEANGGSIGANTVYKIVAGGNFVIKNTFLQYSDTLFNSVGSGSGSKIIFDGIPYIGAFPAGVTFNAGGASTLGYNITFRNINGGVTFKNKLFSTAAWNGGVVPFEIFLYYEKESGSGVMAFASGGAIHMEPASGSADGALGQSLNVRGHIYSEIDNFYRWGVVSSFGDQRPLAIYAGTEGMYVDTLGSFGFNHSGGTLDVSLTRRSNSVLKFNFTGQTQLPSGTTAQRKTGSAADTRYNTDTSTLEYYDGAWKQIASREWVRSSISSLVIPDTLANGSGGDTLVMNPSTKRYVVRAINDTAYNGITFAHSVDANKISHTYTLGGTLSSSTTISGNGSTDFTLGGGSGIPIITFTPSDKTIFTRGIYLPDTTVTGDVTLTSAHYQVFVDATGGNVTVTLPAAASFYASNRGIVYSIKRIDASGNTVTVSRSGSDTIDGGTSTTLSSLQAKGFQASSGNNWWIF